MRPTRLSEVRIQDAGSPVYRTFPQCLRRSGRALIVQYSFTTPTLKMRSGSFYDLSHPGRKTQFKRRRRALSTSGASEHDSICTVHTPRGREDDDEDEDISVLSTHSTHTSSLGGASSITTHHHSCPRHRLSQPNSSLSIHKPVEATCDTHIWYLLLKVSMSVLMATGVAVLASFMYNFPIMQKVELKSLENALHKNLYCQQAAIDALMGHIRGYVERKHEGVVILFLAGSEGSGKTLTVDTFRDVNPKWKKIVATHEQGDLNKLSQEQLIATVRGNIHASTLNFLFIDDIPDLSEGTPFVEMKLKPILRALKFEKTLVFLVITSYEGNTSLPKFLTNEYEHQAILYEAMPRPCVEKCAVDVIRALDANPRYIDMEALMNRIHFDEVNGVQVSKDGCKTVPITVALFLTETVIQQEREHESQHPGQEPNEL